MKSNAKSGFSGTPLTGAFALKAKRRRDPTRREPNGRPERPPQRQRQEDVVALAAENRRKFWGIPEGQERSQLAGSHFGRLRLFEHISTDQYEAGMRWARIVRAHARIIGAPSPVPKSAAMAQMVAAFEGDLETMDPERIQWTRQIYRLISATFLEQREGRQYRNAVASCILEDAPVDTGTLREGLNILVRILR